MEPLAKRLFLDLVRKAIHRLHRLPYGPA
jgi:hypothetical protein